MTNGNVQFEEGEFGTRAILTAPWSSTAHEEIMRVKPRELELNTSKGWHGGDIGFIQLYEWLISFIVIDMKIDDISPVLGLRNLISLTIVTYCKTKLDFSRFPELRRCALEWRSGAESLFDCVTIKHLFVNRYRNKSSKSFSRLVNLESLAILNSSITELRGVGGLHRLRSLRLGGLRYLRELDGVEGLCRLESFELQTCKSVQSLTPLSRLNALVEVNVSNNGKLDSLAPLRGLPHLRTVLFYESTDIIDGDLGAIFDNPAIAKVAFQNRRHYTHKREDFAHRSQG